MEAEFATTAAEHVCQPIHITAHSTPSYMDLMLTSREQLVHDVQTLKPLAASDQTVVIASLEVAAILVSTGAILRLLRLS